MNCPGLLLSAVPKAAFLARRKDDGAESASRPRVVLQLDGTVRAWRPLTLGDSQAAKVARAELQQLIPGEPETEGGESNVDDGEREADRPLAHRERKHRRTMWREATMQEPEGGGGSVRCSLPG